MPMLDAPAVPVILDAMLAMQPVSLGLKFRQALRDVGDDQADPLTLLRNSYRRLGYPADDRRKRLEMMLWPVASMVTGFRCEREFPSPVPVLGDFHVALEAMAIYTTHLLRDVVQFVESSHRGRMRDLYKTEEVAHSVEVALALKPVEVLEAVLEAAWKERMALPYVSSRVVLSSTPEKFAWSSGHDVFTASATGLTWHRYGVIWLGQGHLCGGVPRLDYEERAVLRASIHDVASTESQWGGESRVSSAEVLPLADRSTREQG